MMIIRPVRQDDKDDLRALSRKTGPGFTSMQDDDEYIQGMIESGIRAFSMDPPPADAYYLFVMEESETSRVVGTCAIATGVGLREPFYSYRMGTLVHASSVLDVYSTVNTLTITNDQTGSSELCTLFLDPEYRQGVNGHLLSKCRFLFLAEYPENFSYSVIAEMRGYSDDNGISPFWEGLGRHFFNIDFTQADQLSTNNKVFIAELMPKHTIYTNLLEEAAREAISETHPATVAARKLLEKEGMRYNNYVDIFDAGPMLESPIKDIRAVRDSRCYKVSVGTIEEGDQPFLISNTGGESFRCCTTKNIQLNQNIATVTPETAAAMNIKSGATLRVVPLFAEKRG